MMYKRRRKTPKFLDLKIWKNERVKNQSNYYKRCVWFHKDCIFLGVVRLITMCRIPRASVLSLCSSYMNWSEEEVPRVRSRPITLRCWAKKRACLHREAGRESSFPWAEYLEELERFSLWVHTITDLDLCSSLICLSFFRRILVLHWVAFISFCLFFNTLLHLGLWNEKLQ